MSICYAMSSNLVRTPVFQAGGCEFEFRQEYFFVTKFHFFLDF